jgi:hypothetical protein
MIEVNKPKDTTPNTRCYICKAEFYVHPAVSMTAPFITDCRLHNPKPCNHEWVGNALQITHCKHCGECYK